jgi:hypothetical protein
MRSRPTSPPCHKKTAAPIRRAAVCLKTVRKEDGQSRNNTKIDKGVVRFYTLRNFTTPGETDTRETEAKQGQRARLGYYPCGGRIRSNDRPHK